MASCLQVENLTKSYGEQVLFENISFTIEEGRRVALVAKNGTGKTTLLNIIAGKESHDAGSVVPRRGLRIAYLEQSPAYPAGMTVLEACFHSESPALKAIAEYERAIGDASGEGLQEAMARMDALEAWDYEQRAKRILSRLRIRDFGQKVETLSGGQLKRVALANVLISESDLLILDEPTNHLDTDMTEWLEEYLAASGAGLLMVTHDRYFLDRIAQKIVELDHGKVTSFKGNYSDYSVKKAALRETLIHQYYNQQQQIRHQEQVITKLRQFNREKSIKRAESREKMLDKMDVLEKPTEVRSDMRIRLEPRITSGNDVLTVRVQLERLGVRGKVSFCASGLPGTDAFPGSEFRNQARGARRNHRKQRNGKNDDLKDLKRSHPPGCRLFYTWKPCTDRLLRSGASGAPHGKDHFPGDFRRVSVSDKHRNPKCAGRLPVYKRRCLPTDSYLERR